MIVVTTKDIQGYRIVAVKGIVFGSMDRSFSIGGNVTGKAGQERARVLEGLRWQAVERLMAHATALEANAVIRMRFETSMLNDFTSEVVAYGTAVVVEKGE